MPHSHLFAFPFLAVLLTSTVVELGSVVQLQVFFREHDPTLSKGKAQYKSAIWYHTEQQKEVAEQMIKAISSKSSKPVATDLAPATHWTDAEDYHQNYYHKSGM